MTDFAPLKTCSKCGLEKPRLAFGKKPESRDGLRGECKKCRATYSRAYYLANKATCDIKAAFYREKNKDRLKAIDREYYKKNRQKIIERSNKHYQDNKSAKNDYYKRRRATNHLFRLRQDALNRINRGLKLVGIKKSRRSTEYLGCEWSELARHIERQFLSGMSWDNRTEWHIDHILPLASAKTVDDLIPLLHFTNLRPLWAEDNMAKSDKILYLI